MKKFGTRKPIGLLTYILLNNPFLILLLLIVGTQFLNIPTNQENLKPLSYKELKV